MKFEVGEPVILVDGGTWIRYREFIGLRTCILALPRPKEWTHEGFVVWANHYLVETPPHRAFDSREKLTNNVVDFLSTPETNIRKINDGDKDEPRVDHTPAEPAKWERIGWAPPKVKENERA